MITIVSQTESRDPNYNSGQDSVDSSVMRVETAQQALDVIIRDCKYDIVPMVFFLPDRQQLDELLTRLKGWPEMDAIVLIGPNGSSMKRLDEVFGSVLMKFPVEFC